MKILRCKRCPLNALDQIRIDSDAGGLLSRVLDLEFSIEKFGLDWNDVTAEEVKALQVLIEERHSYEKEQREKSEQDQAMQAALRR